jgi:CHAD domain-containing protein
MTASITTGEQAQQLIAHQLSRVETLRPEVLRGEDPEALHQFRVSLRRLRSHLSQFGPALQLPPRLNRARIAALARATGSCRDVDVLQEHLERQLLPRLDPREQKACAPLRRQLKRQRRQAMKALQAELGSDRAHRLLNRLERWCREPRYTSLGQQSLAEWLPEWLQACGGSCFLHGGWFAAHPSDAELHELRKRIKEVRYGLEALRGWLGEPGEAWIRDLRDVQSCLGDLHDLEVLMQLLGPQSPDDDAASWSSLRRLLEEQRQERWQQWLELRSKLMQPDRRRSLVRLADAQASTQEASGVRSQG